MHIPSFVRIKHWIKSTKDMCPIHLLESLWHITWKLLKKRENYIS